MMKEIGSEFWGVPVSKENKLFSKETKWLISGTAALELILEDILMTNNIQSVGIPSWCCSCMIIPFIKKKIQVIFYPVWLDPKDGLTADYQYIQDCDIVIVLNYFGYMSLKTIGNPRGIVIEDLTHSLLCKKKWKDADYYFGSLRKWAGFYTGGYCWKNNKEWNVTNFTNQLDNEYVKLRITAMEKKKQYIEGKSELKDYLNLFEEAEIFLDTCPIMPGFELDEVRAKHLDIQTIRYQRRKNSKILLNALEEFAVFKKLEDEDCPLFVPLIFPNQIRNDLYKYLISKNVYCPIHWPRTKYHIIGSNSGRLYDQEISIVCDQRYNETEMNYIIDEIMSFIRRI